MSPSTRRSIAGVAALIAIPAAPTSLQARAQAASAPTAITPPAGNVLLLKTRGVGTQDYICLPAMLGVTAWTFERPQASLSVTVGGFPLEAAEHFLDVVPGQALTASPGCTQSGASARQFCPTWRSPLDQSAVWGSKVASETAGTSPDCPNTGAIACLLLKSVANTNGLFKAGLFGNVTYIVRANTAGGGPPTTACHTGQVAQVPYGADYSFFTAHP